MFSLLNKRRFANHWNHGLREGAQKGRVEISKAPKFITITNPPPLPLHACSSLHILNHILGKFLGLLPILTNLLLMKTISGSYHTIPIL